MSPFLIEGGFWDSHSEGSVDPSNMALVRRMDGVASEG